MTTVESLTNEEMQKLLAYSRLPTAKPVFIASFEKDDADDTLYVKGRERKLLTVTVFRHEARKFTTFEMALEALAIHMLSTCHRSPLNEWAESCNMGKIQLCLPMADPALSSAEESMKRFEEQGENYDPLDESNYVCLPPVNVPQQLKHLLPNMIGGLQQLPNM